LPSGHDLVAEIERFLRRERPGPSQDPTPE
jgi:hypothetical protein